MIYLYILQNSLAEPTFLRFLFFFILSAILSQMVRFSFTFYAKVISAFRASHPIHTHVFSSCFCNLFAIILFHLDDISFYHFYHIATFALYQVKFFTKHLFNLLVIQFIIQLLAQSHSLLLIYQTIVAILLRAFNLRESNGSLCNNALLADQVTTLLKKKSIIQVLICEFEVTRHTLWNFISRNIYNNRLIQSSLDILFSLFFNLGI